MSEPATIWDLPGFLSKTRVATSFGEMPIEALRKNDPVKLKSGEYRKVQWVDAISLDNGFLTSVPSAQPILVRKNSLGPGCPKNDILASPGQRLVAPVGWSQTDPQPAGNLVRRPNVSRSPKTSVTYYVFHCGRKDLVQVEGVWCEVST